MLVASHGDNGQQQQPSNPVTQQPSNPATPLHTVNHQINTSSPTTTFPLLSLAHLPRPTHLHHITSHAPKPRIRQPADQSPPLLSPLRDPNRVIFHVCQAIHQYLVISALRSRPTAVQVVVVATHTHTHSFQGFLWDPSVGYGMGWYIVSLIMMHGTF